MTSRPPPRVFPEPLPRPRRSLAARGVVTATAFVLACDPVGRSAFEQDEVTYDGPEDGDSSDSHPFVGADVEAEGGELAPPDGPTASSTNGPEHGGHPVDVGACGSLPNCVDDIPMSGNASELFAEVDHAMRAFMKSKCIGSGVLAISYRNRRVYKRGFGRMKGSAMETLPPHCSADEFEDGDVVLPDTAVSVGSVSKLLPGMIVRQLVQARIDEVEKAGIVPVGTYPDPTAVLVVDPVLELLPPSLLRQLDQRRPDAECPPLAVTDTFTCTRDPGCGATGPDLRWLNVTVGDLLAHRSGLPTSGPSLEGTIAQVGALRGVETLGEFFVENANVKSTAANPAGFEAARLYLAGEANVAVDDVFFVNPWDLTPSLGEQPIDEALSRVAGRCLQSTPAGQSDTASGGGTFRYSNTGYVFLERIVAHLSPTPRFSSLEAETESNSALDEFLTDEGIEEGVRNEFAMFPRRKYGPTSSGGPDRRAFDSEQMTYTPLRSSWLRPFCIWTGTECSFDLWMNDNQAFDKYRLPSNFAFQQAEVHPVTGDLIWTNTPPFAPFEKQRPIIAAGTGGLAMELPALLKLVGRYFIGDTNGTAAAAAQLGRLRESCTACTGRGWKNGIAGGTRALASTLVGTQGATSLLPPVDGSGRLTVEPSTLAWQNVTYNDPNNVDFVVSIHQSADENGGGQYGQIEAAVRYGLSRVDWSEVDRMLERQRMNVVGVGISNTGSSYYWYEDNHKTSENELPEGYHLQPQAVPALEPGEPGGPAEYSVPSTRNGSDVVAVAIAANNRVYAWYDDGHRTGGTSWDLGATVPSYPYTVPNDLTFNDVVGIGISSGNTTWSWFSDGTVGRGTSWALGSTGRFHYLLPPGQSPELIAGMAMNKANDHVFTVFKDGSIAEGDATNLARWGYERGDVAGMGMRNGNTSIWYRSGFRKDLIGSPLDNMGTAEPAGTSDYYVLPSGYEYSDAVGVARREFLAPLMWFNDGARASAGASGDFSLVSVPGTTSYPVGNGAAQLKGIAIAGNATTYSWYNTGTRGKGDTADLASIGHWFGFDTGVQSEFNIDAVAIDTGPGSDNFVWTLFSDGSVGAGRSWDLVEHYWQAPPIP